MQFASFYPLLWLDLNNKTCSPNVLDSDWSERVDSLLPTMAYINDLEVSTCICVCYPLKMAASGCSKLKWTSLIIVH